MVALLLMVSYFAASFGLAQVLEPGSFSYAGVLTAVLVVLTHVIFSAFAPVGRPANLSSTEVKKFFQSKIFWLALISFVSVVAKGLFQVEIDIETQTEIVNLDWGNILQAIISVLLIAIRKYDLLKYIA